MKKKEKFNIFFHLPEAIPLPTALVPCTTPEPKAVTPVPTALAIPPKLHRVDAFAWASGPRRMRKL